jgi:hypothetical protein
MPGRDPSHWLHRFTAEEWMHAAMKELSTARASLDRHSARPALASLRRAAGMAWNAVLSLDATPDEQFGRSYADHLRAIAEGKSPASSTAPVPEPVRDAARLLMDDPVARRRAHSHAHARCAIVRRRGDRRRRSVCARAPSRARVETELTHARDARPRFQVRVSSRSTHAPSSLQSSTTT